MNDRSIQELAIQARTGDQAAYGQLVKQHYRAVYLFSLGKVGNVHDAEDIAQDVFLQGYAKLSQLKDPAYFTAWLRRIAQNRCKEHLRKRRPKAGIPIESVPVHEPDHTKHELHELIARIPKECRVPLVMYYLDGQNVKTVAQWMHISVSSAYGRIREATQMLRALLHE